MPVISVIVPVYKVEAYLERCVNSILKQTFNDFELLLVDDGSPDHCPEMCDLISKTDDRIRVFHQENQGLSAARNAGIRHAKGDYLTFVDSDDWIASTMLEDLLHLSRQYAADISVCGFRKASDETAFFSNQNPQVMVHSRDEFMDIILKINSNRTIHYAWGKLYHRRVIDPEHFPVGMLNEDVEGTFKAVMRSERIVETSAQEYYYFTNEASITHKTFGKNYLCLTDVWKRVLAIAEKDAPQYVEIVAYNLLRMDFTILTDSILLGNQETDRRYQHELSLIRRRLRSNIKKVLAGPMVRRRKPLAWAVCYFYTQIRSIYRIIRRIGEGGITENDS